MTGNEPDGSGLGHAAWASLRLRVPDGRFGKPIVREVNQGDRSAMRRTTVVAL
jgi:hypothetical protein